MSLLVIDESTQSLFELETRSLPETTDSRLSFTGYKIMWRAYDLLVLGGNWPPMEIVALALRKKHNPTFDASGLLPDNPIEVEIATKRELDILEGPSIDIIQLWSLSKDESQTELDACLHNVVASLYQGLSVRP